MKEETREKLHSYFNNDIKNRIAYDILNNIPLYYDISKILKEADEAFEKTKKNLKDNKYYLDYMEPTRKLINPKNENEYTLTYDRLNYWINTKFGKLHIELPVLYKSLDDSPGDGAEYHGKNKIQIIIFGHDYDTIIKAFNRRYPLFIHEFIHFYFDNNPHLSKRLFRVLKDKINLRDDLLISNTDKRYFRNSEESLTQFIDMIIKDGFDIIDKNPVILVPEIIKEYKKSKGHSMKFIQAVSIALMISKYKDEVKRIIDKHRSKL